MGSTIINGKIIANRILEKLYVFVTHLKKQYNLIPSLNVLLIGDDPASQTYVRNKQKKAELVGIKSETILLPCKTTECQLLDIIRSLNNSNTNGILVQLPLPKHINKNLIINTINPDKDVDGFHNENAGKLVTGQIDNALIPCTPQGCLYLIKTILPSIKGKRAVVLGRSNIVGKPMFYLLLQENCTVTILHSFTQDLKKYCLDADIIVSAIGRVHFIKSDWIKPEAIVIDVGMNPIIHNNKNTFTGDVDFINAKNIASAITPVPGGVGPMTIAYLMINTVIATCRQNNIKINLNDLLP